MVGVWVHSGHSNGDHVRFQSSALQLRKGSWGGGQHGDLPGTIRQLPVKGRASWNGRLVLLQDLLTLQAIGPLCGRASGQRHSGGGGHPVPCGVSPEGRLVLAGCSLAVDLVLDHGYAVELGAAPERQAEKTDQEADPRTPKKGPFRFSLRLKAREY